MMDTVALGDPSHHVVDKHIAQQGNDQHKTERCTRKPAVTVSHDTQHDGKPTGQAGAGQDEARYDQGNGRSCFCQQQSREEETEGLDITSHGERGWELD